MTTDPGGDLMLRNLARLGSATPDPARVRRIRTRCHAAIARQRSKEERALRRERFARRVLEPAVVGGLCLIYLLAVIAEVLTRSATL